MPQCPGFYRDYHKQFPGFAAFADYDYATRPESVRKTIDLFANSGIVRKPLISVHGTLDALITLKGHARPYKAMIEAKGYGQNHRLYEIQNGNHVDCYGRYGRATTSKPGIDPAPCPESI